MINRYDTHRYNIVTQCNKIVPVRESLRSSKFTNSQHTITLEDIQSSTIPSELGDIENSRTDVELEIASPLDAYW